MRIPYELEAERRVAETDLVQNFRQVDFSEYEWMEHIEEFDKEMMRMIEEEWFFEQCTFEPARVCESNRGDLVFFDDGSCYLETELMKHFLANNLYNYDMQDDNNNQDINFYNNCTNNYSGFRFVEKDEEEEKDDCCPSSLNPNAAEFVPRNES